MAAVTKVGELVDGHVTLDLVCLDRICSNGHAPTLQVGGQVVSFMTARLKQPIPSRRSWRRSVPGSAARCRVCRGRAHSEAVPYKRPLSSLDAALRATVSSLPLNGQAHSKRHLSS